MLMLFDTATLRYDFNVISFAKKYKDGVDAMKEKLISDEKRKLVNDFLRKVMDDNPDYYYSPTTEIAREIHNRISLEISRLPIDDQVLLKKIQVRDIEIILSYKS